MDLGTVAAVLLAIALVWAAFIALLWVLRPRGTSLRELIAVVPDLLRLLRALVGDRSTPLDVRVVIVVLVALDRLPHRPDSRVHPRARAVR